MSDKQKQAIRDLLDAISLIEENYGYIFRGSDEHKQLIAARRRIKAMVREVTP